MNLDIKNNIQDDETENFVPLGNDEIKSILKKQSETVFEEKNISSKTEFVKKSLIDIALDFETKSKKDEQTQNEKNLETSVQVDEVNEENNQENEKKGDVIKKNFFARTRKSEKLIWKHPIV